MASAAAFVDVDDDGHLDLIVVNDSTPNYLYRNTGRGTFEEVGFPSGFAVNEDGREQAGMGLALGDYDNDGRVDAYITNFSDDSNTLRRNLGDGAFADVTGTARLRAPTIPFLGWGTGFLDHDNDGWLDLFVANGHLYPQVDRFDWGMTWAQRPLLFRNRGGARFEEVPAAPGTGLAAVLPSRGAAFGDIDNDGRIDVVLNNHDAGPTLLRNVAPAGHWIAVRLIGDPEGPRDPIGAVVTLEAGGQRQRRDVISGASYCSQSDFRAHFGFGATTAVAHSERDGAAHFYLPLTDEQDDRLADAQRHAERAVSLDDDLPDAVGVLGRILLKRGSIEAAVRQFERAVSADPDSAAWRFLLAQGYQRLGNGTAAAREFAEAQRLKAQEVDRERRAQF